MLFTGLIPVFLLCASDEEKTPQWMSEKTISQSTYAPFLTFLDECTMFSLASDPANCRPFLLFWFWVLYKNFIWRFESSWHVFLHFLIIFLPKRCAIPLFIGHFKISLDYSTSSTILDNHQKYIIICHYQGNCSAFPDLAKKITSRGFLPWIWATLAVVWIGRTSVFYLCNRQHQS